MPVARSSLPYTLCQLVYSGTQPIKLCHVRSLGSLHEAAANVLCSRYQLVTRPAHSVINQTYESQLRFESPRPFNADGFGLGWYEVAGEEKDALVQTVPNGADPSADDLKSERNDSPLSHIPEKDRPCVYKSLNPAWSNANLTRLAEKIQSRLVFAHVRASTMPGARECFRWPGSCRR